MSAIHENPILNEEHKSLLWTLRDSALCERFYFTSGTALAAFYTRHRVPLRTREELVDWIKRKGEHGGFMVDEATLITNSRGRDYFEKNGMFGLHSAVEYRGGLSVIDPVKFHDTFTRGIGSAKAFGFGLLVIAPLR